MKFLLTLFLISFLLSVQSIAQEEKSNISIIDSVVTAIILDNLKYVGQEGNDSIAIDIDNIGGEKENYLHVPNR